MFRTRPWPEPNLPERVESKETNPSKVDVMEGRALETGEHSDLKGGELIK